MMIKPVMKIWPIGNLVHKQKDKNMDAKEAFEIVMKMAHKSYSKSFGPTEQEKEALEIAEDYMEYWRGKAELAEHHNERPPTGCDYGIGG